MAVRIVDKVDIADYKGENPCLSCASIGRTFGISRERVRQILTDIGQKTRAIIPHYCKVCGKQIFKKVGRRYVPRMCEECKSQRIILVSCDYCGELFPRRAKLVVTLSKRGYNHTFHNYSCQQNYYWQHKKRAINDFCS